MMGISIVGIKPQDYTRRTQEKVSRENQRNLVVIKGAKKTQ